MTVDIIVINIFQGEFISFSYDLLMYICLVINSPHMASQHTKISRGDEKYSFFPWPEWM